MRQLPTLSTRPFQRWRQSVKRPQRISLKREIGLASFKCSCRFHYEARFYHGMTIVSQFLISKFACKTRDATVIGTNDCNSIFGRNYVLQFLSLLRFKK